MRKGQALFVNMSTNYGVNPSLECYTCKVELFRHVGHLEKAVRLMQDMPFSDFSIIWHTLLGPWPDVNVGRWTFERAWKKPWDSVWIHSSNLIHVGIQSMHKANVSMQS